MSVEYDSTGERGAPDRGPPTVCGTCSSARSSSTTPNAPTGRPRRATNGTRALARSRRGRTRRWVPHRSRWWVPTPSRRGPSATARRACSPPLGVPPGRPGGAAPGRRGGGGEDDLAGTTPSVTEGAGACWGDVARPGDAGGGTRRRRLPARTAWTPQYAGVSGPHGAGSPRQQHPGAVAASAHADGDGGSSPRPRPDVAHGGRLSPPRGAGRCPRRQRNPGWSGCGG